MLESKQINQWDRVFIEFLTQMKTQSGWWILKVHVSLPHPCQDKKKEDEQKYIWGSVFESILD